MKPSEIEFGGGAVPFLATFGKVEIEIAAAIIVRVCQARGDEWRAVSWDEVKLVLVADAEAKRPPFTEGLVTNPFARPDFDRLIERGYGTRDELNRIALTDRALEIIGKRWRRKEASYGQRT